MLFPASLLALGSFLCSILSSVLLIIASSRGRSTTVFLVWLVVSLGIAATSAFFIILVAINHHKPRRSDEERATEMRDLPLGGSNTYTYSRPITRTPPTTPRSDHPGSSSAAILTTTTTQPATSTATAESRRIRDRDRLNCPTATGRLLPLRVPYASVKARASARRTALAASPTIVHRRRGLPLRIDTALLVPPLRVQRPSASNNPLNPVAATAADAGTGDATAASSPTSAAGCPSPSSGSVTPSPLVLQQRREGHPATNPPAGLGLSPTASHTTTVTSPLAPELTAYLSAPSNASIRVRVVSGGANDGSGSEARSRSASLYSATPLLAARRGSSCESVDGLGHGPGNGDGNGDGRGVVRSHRPEMGDEGDGGEGTPALDGSGGDQVPGMSGSEGVRGRGKRRKLDVFRDAEERGRARERSAVGLGIVFGKAKGKENVDPNAGGEKDAGKAGNGNLRFGNVQPYEGT